MNSISRGDLEWAAILNGYFSDNRNGVNLSFTSNDMCIMSAYNFGIFAALYVMKKAPTHLNKFLAKYSKLNDTTHFVYPTNMDKNKVEDATILANAFLEIAKVVTSKNGKDERKKVPNGIFEDLQDVLGEVFPKYAKGAKVNLKMEYASLFVPHGLWGDESHKIDNISDENVAKLFAITNYCLCLEDEVEDMFMSCTFSLPVNNANLVQYLSYPIPIQKFGENPSNYMNGLLSSTRKCKSFVEFLNEVDEYKLKDTREQTEMIYQDDSLTEIEKKIEIDLLNDGFIYEITTILLLNGFNLYEDIAKNDIITALQVRSAIGKYNGVWDEENFNKMYVDVVVSILSRKLKDLAIGKKNATLKGTKSLSSEIKKETRVYVDENEEVKALKEKNDILLKQNKELQEKLDQMKRKEGKEDNRISSLESKIKELELALQEKEELLSSTNTPCEPLQGENSEEIPSTIEKDYSSFLNRFTRENSVVMIGGNYNLISKLKGVHPEITYIADNEKSRITDELIKNARIVLFKTDSLGHSAFENAISKCERFGIPFGYLKSLTNTGALEQNICEVLESKLGIEIY